jgi:hypothetical protein
MMTKGARERGNERTTETSTGPIPPHRLLDSPGIALVLIVLVYSDCEHRERWFLVFVTGIPLWFFAERLAWPNDTDKEMAKLARDCWIAASVILTYLFGVHK